MLSKDGSITIKPVDKDRALVVMDTSSYLEELMRQLNDTDVYIKVMDSKIRLKDGHAQLQQQSKGPNQT